jgi:hypothetical protein
MRILRKPGQFGLRIPLGYNLSVSPTRYRSKYLVYLLPTPVSGARGVSPQPALFLWPYLPYHRPPSGSQVLL